MQHRTFDNFISISGQHTILCCGALVKLAEEDLRRTKCCYHTFSDRAEITLK